MRLSTETALVLGSLNVEHPDALFKKGEEWLAIARTYRITSPEAALAGGEDLKLVKALARQLEEKETAITRPINQAHKEVKAFFKPAREWLAEAERLLKGELLRFQAEQDRMAAELQAKADAAATKEREKLERQAMLAGLVGRTEKAEELHDRAQAQIAPIITSAAPKIAGVSAREIWRAEVTDQFALLKHIVEVRPDLADLVLIEQSSLNALAREFKDTLQLPGVRVVKETILAARRS